MFPLEVVNFAQRRPGREPRRHRGSRAGSRPSGTAQRRPGREPRRHVLLAMDLARAQARSTKAGARTPATPGTAGRALQGARRSTKAGARTPATRRWSAGSARPGGALNEGRGANPGDTGDLTAGPSQRLRAQRRPGREPRRHTPSAAATCCSSPAQRRPGREPRRHLPARMQDRALGRRRSTKAGARTPATRCRPPERLRRAEPLNEGRGANPGDTRLFRVARLRHRRRSTKAGARTPATQVHHRLLPPAHCAAQRRPGREPRRHGPDGSKSITCSRLAQRRPGREPRRHPAARPSWCRGPGPLNEGRGANPGDTRRAARSPRSRSTRSTKAGARTPATPADALMKDGWLCPAQRRPGREPRRHRLIHRDAQQLGDRSTKAGARTPATRDRPRAGDRDRGDRSTKAGARTPATPPGASDTPSTPRYAQRRPGREPRRHLSSPTMANPRRRTLNEGRGANPGDTWTPTASRGRTIRSTKAGARTPATPAAAHRPTAAASGAQRRPGREPRRHWLMASSVHSRPCLAQRRPGREPRRHPTSRGRCACWRRRAQRRPGREPRRHQTLSSVRPHVSHALNEGRGANPGDTSSMGSRGGRWTALNEGRGANPGDTPRRGYRPRGSRPLNEGRGANPGDTWRRAGAPRRCSSLNEGRGANPGDT